MAELDQEHKRLLWENDYLFKQNNKLAKKLEKARRKAQERKFLNKDLLLESEALSAEITKLKQSVMANNALNNIFGFNSWKKKYESQLEVSRNLAKEISDLRSRHGEASGDHQDRAQDPEGA